MSVDLSDTLVVGISATALFDMSESDILYQQAHRDNPESAVAVYREHMLKYEDELLLPGTGFPLVKALLSLNRYAEPKQPPLVEVVVMSRNSPDTGLRVLHSIRQHQLQITRSAFTAGESVPDYLDAFDVDLFLTTRIDDAQKVIDSRACAAAILKQPPLESENNISEGQVRIAFDGDAVLFSEESELVYKTEGLEAFRAHEDAHQDEPLQDGPYAHLLRKLSKLQGRLPQSKDTSPVRIALVTARDSPADMRVIKTLRSWGVHVDEAFFLGGVGKPKVLKAFRPHIFFDDQDVHLDAAALLVPSGKVLYRSTSLLKEKVED
ncbi:5'-nucleotidase [Neptunomonas antarctica]|uniref:5'-nucleotidase n=1 Tax=Neptunomonas antarctica TaxID=619304 RepID=A0A1N7P4L5_9GAMM|nr:5'-nucleotidase [Neptunomonas antarctica]SIT05498.1 5'-nucleotidase [Neptunomonas antarctica]